jgi:HEAT repeat protein
MILQRAGYKDETTPFFQNCLETFPNDELRATCATGLAANDPDKALSILVGLMDNKYPEEVQQAALRLIGDIAATKGLPKEKKDAAVDELTKRSKGMMNTSLFPAAIEGLRRARDPRAVEPLRGLTKGLKGEDVKLAALRALLLGYDDAGARESLQKKLKGGFMVEEKDRLPAVLVLIEAGDPVGLDWALQYLTKKKKKDPDLSPDLVDALVARGDEPARGVLAKALPTQKGTDWIAADMAIGLLQLGDASGLETVRTALTNRDWPNTRIQAAVVLARQQKDYSGVPVLKAMTESDSLLKTALKLTIGKAVDIESMRSAVATALGRIDHADGVPLLVGLLGDKSERVRLSAAYALARMTDPAVLDGFDRALDVDYGKEGSRSRNPEVRAHLLRVAAARFPGDARSAALLKKGSASDIASLRFLAVAETKVVSR